MCGAISGILLSIMFLALTSYLVGGMGRVKNIMDRGLEQGLNSIELLILGVGVAIGFGLGVGLWSLISTRYGWLTLDEVIELFEKKPDNQ